LRKQVAEQLARLKAMQQEQPGQPAKTVPQQPSTPPQGKPEAGAPELPRTGERLAAGQIPQPGQAVPGAAAAGAEAGRLSMDLELALVGTAHHFSKLHGEPRLVVRARHESLSRGLAAMVWASLCLAVAVAVIQSLRRPDALSRVYRGWPWLTAVAGVAWLFVLPAGVFGLALMMLSLCVLIARLRKPRAGSV
jgi:hypothetical protein